MCATVRAKPEWLSRSYLGKSLVCPAKQKRLPWGTREADDERDHIWFWKKSPLGGARLEARPVRRILAE